MTNLTTPNATTPNPATPNPATPNPGAVPETARSPKLTPRCDVVESESAVHLVAEMPGVDESGVRVQLEEGVLTITGTPAKLAARGAAPESASEAQGSAPAARGVWSEFELGSYERRFRLSDAIDPDGIRATIANGLLTVELAKRAPRARTIEVTAGDVAAG